MATTPCFYWRIEMTRFTLPKLPFALSTVAIALLAAGAAQAADSLDGRIRVVNERMAPIQVSIDGQQLTRLASGERRVFREVPNGVRLVRVHGPRGRHQDTARVAVPIEGVAVHRIEARFGQASIVNDSGVRMRLVLDGRALGVAAPGQALQSWPLAAGTYTLEARPASREHRDGPALTRRVKIRRGQQESYAVGAWFSRIEAANPFPFAANLWVDGQRVERVRPGGLATVVRQVPGAHRVVFKRDGRVLAADTMRVAPGRTATWRPVDVNRGDLRVTNRTGDRVRVMVDGRELGRLGRGESRTFANLDAGVRLVTLERGGRTVDSQRVRIAAHGVAEVVARRDAPRRRPQRRDDHPAPIARR